MDVTENTYSIHYFNGGWISDEKKKVINGRKQVIRKYEKLARYVYYGIGIIKCADWKQFMREVRDMFH